MSFLRRQESIISQGFLSTILDPCFRRDDKKQDCFVTTKVAPRNDGESI
ncbi:hypothetical protein [Candidatus Tisiphia endosymbiont of Hybos culiciformis]